MKVKIEDLKKECRKYFESYEDYIIDYYNYSNNVDDILYQIANDNVDIYTYDLMEWLKDNYSYVEDYVKEFGIDANNFDFLAIVSGGQFIQIEESLHNNRMNILEFLAYYIIEQYGIKEIEEEKATEISMINFDLIEYINELEDEIKEILEIEE